MTMVRTVVRMNRRAILWPSKSKAANKMSSPTFLTSGGAPVDITSTSYEPVATIIYPGAEIDKRGLQAHKVWFAADASSTGGGLELVLKDNMGNAVAGPSVTYGGSGVFSLMALLPLRTARLRTSGPPIVLELKARNRQTSSTPSRVGQVMMELREK